MSDETIRIVGITDLHLHNFNLSCWKNDTSYKDLLFDCLNQVLQFSIRVKANALVVAGDVFHSRAHAKNPTAFLNETIKVFRSFWQHDIPVLGIAGNHDQAHGSNDKLLEQPLGTLMLANAYLLLDNSPYRLCTNAGFTVRVSGASFFHGEAEPVLNLSSDGEDYHVGLGHFLFGKQTGTLFHEKIFGPDYLKNSSCDVLFMGHRHEDQGARLIDGKYYVAPGALTRTGLYAHDLTRKPALVYMEFAPKTPVKIALARLKVPPIDEIFNLAGVQEKQEEAKQLQKFIEQLNAQVATGDDLQELIQSLNLSQEVYSRCRHYIEDAEKTLTT
jgi:DNA repair exonuclease SbcCD nuclease subunit